MFVQFFQVFAWKAKLCIATMRVIVGTFQALALQVVLAERSLREMQGQVRLHFRTQDPQGLAEAAYLGDLGRSNPHESPSLMADWMFNHLSMFSITNHEAHLISNWPVQRSITRSYARKHPTSLHDFAPLHPLHLSDFHAQPLGAYKRLHCVSYREGCKSHRIELMKVCWGNGLKVETGISMMEETWRNHEALFTLSYLARTCFLQYFLPLFTALSKSSHHWMDKVISIPYLEAISNESCSRVEAVSGTLSTSCVFSQSCVFWLVSTCFRNRRFAPAQPNTSSSCVLRRQIAVLTMRRDKVTKQSCWIQPAPLLPDQHGDLCDVVDYKSA